MASAVSGFADADINYDGLDGRDLTVIWGSGALAGFDYFESYRVYVLPAAATFGSGTQYLGLIPNADTLTWTGDTKITKDSFGNPFVPGASYKACVAIMATSGMLGAEGCSTPATLTADVVTHASILSAKFTSDTTLELTTDATLDADLSSHSGVLVTYQIGANTYTGTAIASVNSPKISITIPSLGNPAVTATNLIVQTGALHASGGGFNNYFSSGSLTITDGQVPVISGFVNNTAPQFGNFYKGNLSLTYSFSELMAGAGNTSIIFTRVS